MDDGSTRFIDEAVAESCERCSKNKLASMTIGSLVKEAALKVALDMLQDDGFVNVTHCEDCKRSVKENDETYLCYNGTVTVQVPRRHYCGFGVRTEE